MATNVPYQPMRIFLNMQLGAADATMIVDGTPYTPDLGRDIQSRVQQSLAEAVRIAFAEGIPVPETYMGMSTEEFESMMNGDGDEDGDTE